MLDSASEFHLVHALASVPMEESLATEHSSKLFRDALEELLDGGRVADESSRHLQTPGWNVANSRLDVVRDPLDEVGRVLVLDVEHLLVDLLHRHATAENGGDSQVATVARIAGSHHVLGVEHLLCQLGYCEGAVLLRAAGSEWSEARHEEMKTWEGHHVDGQFAQIGIQLAREAEAGRDARHGERDQVIKVTVGWSRQLEGTEADVVQRLVVDAVRLVRVLNQLVDGESSVVGLDDSV